MSQQNLNVGTVANDGTGDTVRAAFQKVQANTTELYTDKLNASAVGTAAAKNVGTSAGQVPVLDGSGLLDTAVLPALAVSDVSVVASQVAMLALTAQRGDVAVRTDLNKSYILSTNSPSTLADWKELLTPTDAVLSVAGLSGAISVGALMAALGAFGVVRTQAFTSSGTYTPHASMVYAQIETIGAGGAGGGITVTAANACAGGGGGAGGVSRKIVSKATVGASQTVTIGAGGSGSSGASGGAGGDTSVGTLCIGKGGSGGEAFNGSGLYGAGGAGGVAGTGDVAAVGGRGSPGLGSTSPSSFYGLTGGNGGYSPFGEAGGGGFTGYTPVAGNAGSKGGGGGGASGGGGATGSAAGGAGGAGYVLVTEFCSA